MNEWMNKWMTYLNNIFCHFCLSLQLIANMFVGKIIVSRRTMPPFGTMLAKINRPIQSSIYLWNFYNRCFLIYYLLLADFWQFYAISCQIVVSSQNFLAFWKRKSQGPTSPGRLSRNFSGIQGHCQERKHRSGWGIIARCLPSAEHNAAIPSGEPFGLNGYSSVTSFSSFTYL